MAKTPSRKHRPTAEAAGPLITGRVTAGHGRHYFVTTEDGAVLEAHRRGKKGDVVVGDVVECTEPVSGVSAIESIRERRNLLYRSDEWRIKSLAANIDLVCIVFASRPTFNPWFIWKALLAAHQAGIPALVIRNKAELAEGAEEAAAAVRLLESIGHDVITVSATGEPEATRARLIERLEGRASLLVGQSGMGKSIFRTAGDFSVDSERTCILSRHDVPRYARCRMYRGLQADRCSEQGCSSYPFEV